MNRKSVLIFCCTTLFAIAVGSSVCQNPKVESTYFTTSDATIVSQIGLVGEFSLKCADPSSESISLFAEVNGRLTPVAKVPGGKYQVRLYKKL